MSAELAVPQCSAQEGVIGALVVVVVLMGIGTLHMRRSLTRHYVNQSASQWRVRFEDLVMVKKLGEGAFGSVHKARWLGKDVAVKVFNQQQCKGVHLTAFVLEVSILSDMRHPNVVMFLGASFSSSSEEGGGSRLAIVMELMKCSIYDYIQAIRARYPGDDEKLARAVPWLDRLHMLLESSLGLTYLHGSSLIHHDLKSANILLALTGFSAKICDFGMASLKSTAGSTRRAQLLRKSTEYMESADASGGMKTSRLPGFRRGRSFRSESRVASSNLSVTSTPVKTGGPAAKVSSPTNRASAQGLFRRDTTTRKITDLLDGAARNSTPQWTAPEVVEGHPYTEAADVYSFGVIMAEVCALQEPYPGMTPYQVTLQVVDGLRPQIPSDSPEKIVALAKRCMHADPAERPPFSSIAKTLQALELSWETKGSPDRLASKFRSSGFRSRQASSHQPDAQRAGDDIFSQENAHQRWWIKENTLRLGERISAGDYSETFKATLEPAMPSPTRARTNESRGRSTRRVSISGVLGMNRPKRYAAGTRAESGMAPEKKTNLAGSLIFTPFHSAKSPAVQPDDQPSKDVVAKVYDISGRNDLCKHFVQEMGKRFELRHNNLEVVFGGYTNATTCCVVTEHAKLGSLRDVLDAGHLRVGVNELLGVLTGLKYLHDRSVLHNRLSAETVLCYGVSRPTMVQDGSPQGFISVKLAGVMFHFLAKAFSKQEQKVGSPAYSAPEVVMAEQYSAQADVYSFGILCWESLTRKRPFEGYTFQQVGHALCMENERPQVPDYDAQQHGPRDYYDMVTSMMRDCWEGDAAKRPTLDALQARLAQSSLS